MSNLTPDCFASIRSMFFIRLLMFPSLFLLAILLIGCSSNVPSFAFVATIAGAEDDTPDIYIGSYQRGGTVVERVTQTPERELFPTISSDEKWILYKIDGTRLENRLYLLELSTGATKGLGRGGYVIPGPFKPDGSNLIYMSASYPSANQQFLTIR